MEKRYVSIVGGLYHIRGCKVLQNSNFYLRWTSIGGSVGSLCGVGLRKVVANAKAIAMKTPPTKNGVFP